MTELIEDRRSHLNCTYKAQMPSAIDNCMKELNSVIEFNAVERENCKYIIEKHFPQR